MPLGPQCGLKPQSTNNTMFLKFNFVGVFHMQNCQIPKFSFDLHWTNTLLDTLEPQRDAGLKNGQEQNDLRISLYGRPILFQKIKNLKFTEDPLILGSAKMDRFPS